MVAYLVAEADRMTLQAYITPGEATPTMAVGDSDLAMSFPADTQLYIETRELGSSLEAALVGLLATMDEDAVAELAPFEDMLGSSLPEFLDFMADAGIGAAISSDGLWLGIAAEVTDEDRAAKRVERILSIIRLLASGLGSETETGITVERRRSGTPRSPSSRCPSRTSRPRPACPSRSTRPSAWRSMTAGSSSVSESSWKHALTETEADSLAASAGYVDALGADVANSGLLYANIGALLAELDPLLTMMAPEWADIQPYATALDRFIAVGTVDDEVIGARMSIIVGQ